MSESTQQNVVNIKTCPYLFLQDKLALELARQWALGWLACNLKTAHMTLPQRNGKAMYWARSHYKEFVERSAIFIHNFK